MKQYLDLLRHIKENGSLRGDRTGTGTISVFGTQTRYNLQEGFPLLTTKRVHFKSVVHELLWFLKGETNIKYLKDNGVRIWDSWVNENGDLGPIYGAQWRTWTNIKSDGSVNFIDQIAEVIEGIRSNPLGRRHIVSAWNVADLEDMALPPCHLLFQFYVEGNKLSCQLYQRSADMFLGVPFNIASYALLTHMIAACVGLEVGEFIHTTGDTHIYLNHMDQVNEQLSRFPTEQPRLRILGNPTDIDSISFDDIILEDYSAQPAIKAPVAV